jgi:sugar lactone lactonase YvrE
MLKHVARTPIVVNLKSRRFIRVPAQPPTSCVTAGKSFPSLLCCESWAQRQPSLRTQHSAASCLAT